MSEITQVGCHLQVTKSLTDSIYCRSFPSFPPPFAITDTILFFLLVLFAFFCVSMSEAQAVTGSRTNPVVVNDSPRKSSLVVSRYKRKAKRNHSAKVTKPPTKRRKLKIFEGSSSTTTIRRTANDLVAVRAHIRALEARQPLAVINLNSGGISVPGLSRLIPLAQRPTASAPAAGSSQLIPRGGLSARIQVPGDHQQNCAFAAV